MRSTRTLPVIFLLGILPLVTSPALGAGSSPADPALNARFAGLALDCVHQEYPNKIAHVMQSDRDALPPRELTPAFFGCYDWHSSVHGHWLLARLARIHPGAPFAAKAREALAVSLTPEKITVEADYLAGEGRKSFERPYGLAWLMQLAAELRQWQDPRAKGWSEALKPLESAARKRLASWIPKLTYAIRAGEHSQSAFAFGLMLDWSRTADDRAFQRILVKKVRELYLQDEGCPMGYEPGGQDFLSPCLAEADLVRRILPAGEYARWLSAFLPGIPEDASSRWLEPAVVSDRSDGKLAHLDGLNLSRAWMLEGIASGLPAEDPRLKAIQAAAALHRARGLAAVTGEHYEGGHWLGSFATYLVTRRGLPDAPGCLIE